MNSLLRELRPQFEGLCRQLGVEQLDVFGSASRDDFHGESDFDFVVRFGDTGPGYADRFLALAEALEKLLGRPVDLLTERSLRNPILVASIARDRKTVYAA